MLDKKGFTLVELLAMMVILGILMAVTIPNIVGIAEANKKQAYAEDALKFKNTVEYLLRGDEDYIKPSQTGHCVVVSLTHLLVDSRSGFRKDAHGNINFIDTNVNGTEYENAPYGGAYLIDYSYVVMKKNSSNEYEYYVQLVENLPDGGYRGIKLTNYKDLESNGYLGKVDDVSSPGFNLFNWDSYTIGGRGIAYLGNAENGLLLEDGTKLCSSGTVDAIYYANGVRSGRPSSTITYPF